MAVFTRLYNYKKTAIKAIATVVVEFVSIPRWGGWLCVVLVTLKNLFSPLFVFMFVLPTALLVRQSAQCPTHPYVQYSPQCLNIFRIFFNEKKNCENILVCGIISRL